MQESARHLQMTRARQMRVDTRDLPEALTIADPEKEGIGDYLKSLPSRYKKIFLSAWNPIIF